VRVGAFYDKVGFLYPIVNLFFQSRRSQMIRLVNSLRSHNILEIGVGPGNHLGDYTAENITVVDVSVKMIESCRENHPRVNAILMDGESLNFPDGCFDVVVLSHVLSVTDHPQQMLAAAHRVLRPDGHIIILNYDADAENLRKFAQIWRWPAAWLGCRSDFHLSALSILESFSLIQHEKSGILNQFTLSLWKK
jgi:phosphatidylethanolamine/phosphatidyl-N-methylethanolamine N-methyltransferase